MSEVVVRESGALGDRNDRHQSAAQRGGVDLAGEDNWSGREDD